MLKKKGYFYYKHMLLSDSETESEDMSKLSLAKTQKRKCSTGKGTKNGNAYGRNPGVGLGVELLSNPIGTDCGARVRRYADAYQQYMKQLAIPSKRSGGRRGSSDHAPYATWREMGNSMKQLYGQPLHYLTNLMLQRCDDSRIGGENEHKPMHSIIEPSVAEATIWVVEEFHRLGASAQHVAHLWLNDPNYTAFVDPIPHIFSP